MVKIAPAAEQAAQMGLEQKMEHFKEILTSGKKGTSIKGLFFESQLSGFTVKAEKL